MRKVSSARTFKASGQFAVQWQRNGALRVLYAPMMDDENPFFFSTKSGYIDLIKAADSVTEDCFSDIGRTYYDQYQALPETEKSTVTFPPVKFTISVNCRVDIKRKTIIAGVAKIDGKFTDLHGTSKPLRYEKEVENLSARTHHLSFMSTPQDPCSWDLHVPHSDCEWSWFQCVCAVHPCCPHIVQPFGDTNWYNERCGWWWSWFKCMCTNGDAVACPHCFKTSMSTLKQQLKKLGIKPPKIISV